MQTASIEKCLQMKNVLFIDVRSEKEFEEGTIPHAVHIPIFNNEERSLLGHMYKNINKSLAKEKGLEIASQKLPDLYFKIKEAAKDYNRIVIFCWRGGMRSRSITTVMNLMHLPVVQLEGGYKAYRRYILNEFNNWHKKSSPFIVLHGNTGCGKTILLEKLKTLQIPVLNLEQLANHRGSVFGGIGLGNQPSQKTFEAEIFDQMMSQQNTLIFVEAESAKIGKRIVPPFIINGIRQGIHILVTCDKNIRIQRLINEYAKYDFTQNKQNLQHALYLIQPYIPKKIYNIINDSLKTNDLKTTTSLLLEYYYDPKYEKWYKYYNVFHYEIDSSDISKAVKQLTEIFEYEKNVAN